MAGNKMGEQTRERILAAAEMEFIEKGFENSRVEEIAIKAGVTKVMLYYHFNTKQNIFNEIVKKVISEISQEFRENMKPADRSDPAVFQAHLSKMLGYYENRKNILRLILAEYIMKRQGVDSLAVFNDVFNLVKQFAGKESQEKPDDFLVNVFFFNTLPMLLFACMGDSFCEDFGITPEKARQIFTTGFIQVFQQSNSNAGPN